MIPAAVLRRRPGLLSLRKNILKQISQLAVETMKEKSTDLSK